MVQRQKNKRRLQVVQRQQRLRVQEGVQSKKDWKVADMVADQSAKKRKQMRKRKKRVAHEPVSHLPHLQPDYYWVVEKH